MKFAHYDEVGRVLSFHDPAITPQIPEPFVEITDEDWLEHVEHRAIITVASGVPALADLPPLSLDQRKAQAVGEAQAIAIDVRRQIGKRASPERVFGWVIKAQYAMVWAAHDAMQALPDVAAAFAPFATVAVEGFGHEVALTGEDAATVRDRALAKAAAYFRAMQVVEGMERLAEDGFPGASTEQELELLVADLRQQEATARDQVAGFLALT